MTEIAHAISAALLHFVWEGLAVAFLLWVTLATLRYSPARLRYMVSCGALAVMSALPFITAGMVYRASGVAAASAGQVVNSVNTGGPATLTVPTLLPQWIAALEAWALPFWSAGVLVFAVRLIWSSRYVTKLQRNGEQAGPPLVETVARLARRMSIVRPVRVLTSRLTDSPSVVGWLRPVILLPPATLMNLSTSQLEAVLAHELAHIRRCDYLANLLQTVAETLFFYQPAIWWVSSRIRNERELCCDDLAVEVCGDPAGYARALTQLERSRAVSPELAMSGTGGSLMYRIQRLTGVADQRPVSKVPAALAVCLAMICFLTNVHWAKAQSPNGNVAEIRREAIWVDSVKFGDLPIEARARGTLTTPATAELNVPSPQFSDLVQLGQSASVQLHNGITVAGKVSQIGSRTVSGTVPVVVQLQTPVSESAGQEVDGTIRVRTLNDVVYVGRPAGPQTKSESTLFRLESDGRYATRVKVRFGAFSVNTVEVLEGLQPGDRVILSGMAKYDGFDRIRLQ